jgi:hypothetical protein
MLVMGLFSRLGGNLTQIPQITQIHTAGIFLLHGFWAASAARLRRLAIRMGRRLMGSESITSIFEAGVCH